MSSCVGMDRLNVDIAVVGAGSAGARVARGFAEQGRRVLLVDKRPRGATGARWVNAVPYWCLERAGVTLPTGAQAFAHTGKRAIHLRAAADPLASIAMSEVGITHVDMRVFVDSLVDQAEAVGAEFLQASLDDLTLADGRVGSLLLGAKHRQIRVQARLVVDASGIGGAVRRRVDVTRRRWREPMPPDRCSAAQFQYTIRDRGALEAYLARLGAQIGDDLVFTGVAGGYSTLALFSSPESDEVGVLTGCIPAMGADNAGSLLEMFASRLPFLGERRFGGQGAIPLRRPYTELGALGVALVGDAACQVYASHGSGVGMGLIAASLLVDAAREQDDPGSASVLSRYTMAFRRELGGLLAASDVFRRHAQGLSGNELIALLRSGLLDPRLAAAVLSQRPARPDLTFLKEAPSKFIARPGIALRFAPLAMKTLLADRIGPLSALQQGGAVAERLLELLVGEHPASGPLPGPWTLPAVDG